MSDEKKTSIFDDFEELVSSGAEIAKSFRGAITSHRAEGVLTAEPISQDFQAHFRALLEKVEDDDQEAITSFQIVKGRIRVIIGEGGRLRVYEGANVVEAVEIACAAELLGGGE